MGSAGQPLVKNPNLDSRANLGARALPLSARGETPLPEAAP